MYQTVKPMGYMRSNYFSQGYSVVKPSYMTGSSSSSKTAFACMSTCRTPIGCTCGRS